MRSAIACFVACHAWFVGCARQTPSADIALSNVTIVDVRNGSIASGRDVLISGNRISRISTPTRRPVSATKVIDATGKYLIPGLWDMHVHSSSDRITRDMLLPLYIANGVTGVRDMKGDCFDPCEELESSFEQVQRWRDDISAGRLVGPRILASSPFIESPLDQSSSTSTAPATANEARELVGMMKNRGVDFIKVYSLLRRDAFLALAEAAKAESIIFAGHVPVSVPASEVSDNGQRSIEHLHGVLHECSSRAAQLRDSLLSGRLAPGTMLGMASESLDHSKCAELHRRFISNQTWIVPTLSASPVDSWRKDPRLQYVPPAEQSYWRGVIDRDAQWFPLSSRQAVDQRFSELVGTMHVAGVSILAGSDVGTPFVFAGFGLHDELERLVGAGLPASAALRAATLGPAQFLGSTDSLGMVAEGRLADLVLLNANPLEEIRNTRAIHAVLFNGRYLDRTALDDLLAAVRTAAQR